MSRTSRQGLDLIRHFESFRPTVYLCPAGYPTVGYGHVVLLGEDFSEGLTEAQATALLAKDVQLVERQVLGLTPASRRLGRGQPEPFTGGREHETMSGMVDAGEFLDRDPHALGQRCQRLLLCFR